MTPADATLLVVDDNEDNRYTLVRRLKREGYANVVTANDGRQGLALMREQLVDLLLLDIMMPEMDGYQVLEHLKNDATLSDVPVIMISALEEMESVIRCIELGAEDYLSKPFNPTLLRARVGASLEKKRLRDTIRASLTRLEQEIQTARTLQLEMLPTSIPDRPATPVVKVHGFMDPAREVGGDLYDFFWAPDGTFCFLIGDVSGKGAGAAMFMARIRSLARMAVVELLPQIAEAKRSPAFIAEVLNRELGQNNRQRMFVTLFLGFLQPDSGELTWTNAGHPPPCILRADGQLERIASKPQPPIAVCAGVRYENQVAKLSRGEVLFAYTDGVTDAVTVDGERYGIARLDAGLQTLAGAAPLDVVQAIKEDIDTFSAGTPKADDVTMLAFRVQSEPSPLARTELVIANDLTQIPLLSRALSTLGAAHDIAPKSLTELQIALDELASNVIKYAWPQGGNHQLTARITVLPNEMAIEILDDGQAFNPLNAPPPPAREGNRPRPGGLGIHLLKQLVDQVEYSRTDGLNRLRITKKFTPDGDNHKRTPEK